MPSIRVRRSRYSHLTDPSSDSFSPEPSSHLSSIFRRSRTTHPQRPLSTGDIDTSDHLNAAASSVLQTGRPRTGSLVSQHVIMQESLRASGASFSDDRSRVIIQTSPIDSPISQDLVDNGRLALPWGHRADGVVLPETQHGSLRRMSGPSQRHQEDDLHQDGIIEHLDVIDPEISTIASLANAANALVIPPLPLYSRKPTVAIPTSGQLDVEGRGAKFSNDLDRHVDDCLERPSKFRRTMRGVWAFLKTPIGIVTGLYGFLVVFWGAAIVLFLAKIINLHNANAQGFWLEVSSQVENGLFAIVGIGFLPARCLDTYRIFKIWSYKRRTQKLRSNAGLPQLYDVDDLPDPIYDPNYVHVLTEAEQEDLHKQQVKFRHSQTWYRPHGTDTHRASPINTSLLICCLNDGNSFFQILLCGTMWGLDRFHRPAWSTGVLISFALLCAVLSGVFIWRISAKTKRTQEVRERLRAALAMADSDKAIFSPDHHQSSTSAEKQTSVSLPVAAHLEHPTTGGTDIEETTAPSSTQDIHQ